MAQIQVITALLLAVAVQLASSRGLFYYREDEDEFASNSSCTGTPNPNQPWVGQPTFVRQIENGTLYTAGDAEDMIYGILMYYYTARTLESRPIHPSKDLLPPN
jgi:hypothetical protein